MVSSQHRSSALHNGKGLQSTWPHRCVCVRVLRVQVQTQKGMKAIPSVMMLDDLIVDHRGDGVLTMTAAKLIVSPSDCDYRMTLMLHTTADGADEA